MIPAPFALGNCSGFRIHGAGSAPGRLDQGNKGPALLCPPVRWSCILYPVSCILGPLCLVLETSRPLAGPLAALAARVRWSTGGALCHRRARAALALALALVRWQ